LTQAETEKKFIIFVRMMVFQSQNHKRETRDKIALKAGIIIQKAGKTLSRA